LIKGVVGRINKKPYEGKTLTSFALKGQDGWYSLGERAPTFNEGDSIQFEVETRGRYAYAKDIVQWAETGSAEAPRVPSRPYRANSQKSFGKSQEEKDYWAKRDATQEVTQRRIEIQAARNAAIETSKFLWEKELVAKPKKVADQYDAFLALIDQVATAFIANTESRLGVSEGRGDKGETGGNVAESEKASDVASSDAIWDE
jgi:hypothetical protein